MKRFLLLSAALIGSALLAGCQSPPDDRLGAVADFHLTDLNNRPVSRDDLKGQVWLGTFIFTRCNNTCPQFTAAMAQLQKDLAQYNDFRLVSITLDPDYDTPEVLRQYANRFGADLSRWYFLIGDQATVHRLSTDGLKMAVEENKGADRKPGNEFMHMPRAFLVDKQGQLRGYVDKQGQVRGYYDLREEDQLAELRKKVPALVREKP